MKFDFHVRTLDNKLLVRRAQRERGVWPLAARKSDSLQYGFGAVSVSPQRQRASKKLGFSREKNIDEQLAQLATASGATETNISRMLLFLTFAVCCLLFAQMQSALWELNT